LQQQATEDQYVYYNNLQHKNNEISKLKGDLKQAHRQIQVLRKTMEQLLKADGKDFDDNSSFDNRKRYLASFSQCYKTLTS
jgi:predicted RNase H-like nuclease (RuvC/YqgF family)